MKCIVFGFLLCSGGIVFGQDSPTPLGSVKDGVYFLQGVYQTTIVELRAGEFRYWFASDAKVLPEPDYPLSGKYSATNGVVTLPHKDIYQKEWTFMNFKGQVTLWRPSAIKYWHEAKKIDNAGVLYPVDRKPKEIWGKRPH